MPHCKILTNHICVRLPGYFKPCCYWNKDYGNFSNERDQIPLSAGFKNYYSSDLHQSVIQTMNVDGGWDPGCAKCKEIEESGLESMRQKANKDPESGITWMQISLSNFCNFACKMCDTRSSSTISKLVQNNPSLGKWFHSVQFTQETDVAKIFDNVDLSKLNMIEFLGGEPFVDPQTTKFLNYLDSKDILNNITFKVHTNTSFFPKKMEKQLSKLKHIDLRLSVDTWNKKIEYIRLGSNFDTIQSVTHQWVEYRKKYNNCNITIFPTIGALTLDSLKDTIQTAEKLDIGFDYEYLDLPEHLNRNALPEEYVESIRDKYNDRFLNNYKFDESKFIKLKEFISDTDGTQGKFLKDYYPLLAKYIEGE
jgi:organic radical activating enzyme